MNEQRAKALRKLARFKVGKPRHYMMKKTERQHSMPWICVDEAYIRYQSLKKGE